MRPGRGFIADTKELLEYYLRRPENFTSLDAVSNSKTRMELKNGFALQVTDRGFSIMQIGSEEKESVVKRVEFKDSFNKFPELVRSFSSDNLPNSLMRSGPSSWLFNVYFPDNHSIHTYGIKINESTLQLEYLYRVKLFSEGLISPPYIVHGPATVYKGIDGKVHAYWYLEESDDVEKLFESQKPIEGDLKDPAIDKDGNLTFRCGDNSFSHPVFVREYWQKHLERMNKGD